MTGLGPDHAHPYLVSLIDNELVVYKAFPLDQTKNPGHLSLRFSKVCASTLYYTVLHVHVVTVYNGKEAIIHAFIFASYFELLGF